MGVVDWLDVGELGWSRRLGARAEFEFGMIDPRDQAGRAPEQNETLREGSMKVNCGGKRVSIDVGELAF